MVARVHDLMIVDVLTLPLDLHDDVAGLVTGADEEVAELVRPVVSQNRPVGRVDHPLDPVNVVDTLEIAKRAGAAVEKVAAVVQHPKIAVAAEGTTGRKCGRQDRIGQARIGDGADLDFLADPLPAIVLQEIPRADVAEALDPPADRSVGVDETEKANGAASSMAT